MGKPTSATDDFVTISAPLMIHDGELDKRLMAVAGFHNNSTPRYNEAAATLAWERTIAFFSRHLAQT